MSRQKQRVIRVAQPKRDAIMVEIRMMGAKALKLYMLVLLTWICISHG